MSDELALPQLPAGNGLSAPNKRVRTHQPGTSSPAISSDPPLFSSDDDAAAENYTRGPRRMKKGSRGPWWNHREDSVRSGKNMVPKPASRRHLFERNLDSGVFMGSDSTEGDEDAEFPSRVQLPSFASSSHAPFSFRSTVPIRSNKPLEPLSQEELADKYIQDCIDEVRQDIDLSDRGLSTLLQHTGTIRQLRYLVAAPSICPPYSYHPLDTDLKIFLSSNNLARAPGEVFNLTNLTVLSLRNNKLIELSSAVSKLESLVELNVANNSLRYLPYELLVCMTYPKSLLRRPQLHPNPFYQPDDSAFTETSILPLESRHTFGRSHLPAVYNYRSQVRFLSNDGTLVKGPTLQSDHALFTSQFNTLETASTETSSHSVAVAPLDDTPEAPNSTPVTKAFSLHELAVQAWLQVANNPGDLSFYLGEEAPPRLSRLLDDAKTLRDQEGGDRYCTICHRAFIIPRTEWIEWWDFEDVSAKERGLNSAASPLRQIENRRDESERKIPFMRRGCSWKCVPAGDVEADLDSAWKHLADIEALRQQSR